MALASPDHVALAEALLQQQGRRSRARCAFWAGVRKSVPLVPVAERARGLADPDQRAGVFEALAGASPSERPALQRLAVELLEEAVEQGVAAAEGSALERLGATQLSVEYELIALPDGMRERRVCPDRKRRATLHREELRALEPLSTAQAERIERRLALRSQSGVGSEEAYGALLGLDLPALGEASASLLRETRDAAQDLLAYRLRRARVDAAGGGSAHDLTFALELLDLREQVHPIVARRLFEQLARDLGLDPFAAGRITVDAEARAGRFPGLKVGRFGADELAVVCAPLESPADGERLMAGHGQALHRASIDADRSAIERGLVNPALVQATGHLFSGVLAEPAWLRRALRLPSRPAQEVAQAFGLRALLQLRAAAAQLLFARELEQSGPSPRLREQYRERMGEALFVEVPGQGAWETSLAEAASALTARALAASLATALLESFNEDWWRNPHATELLRSFWSPGGAVDLVGLLGAAPRLGRLGAEAIARAAR